MLKDVIIKNYRCFEDFTIDGLSQVNLIVGSNQIGKTSLLEAIYLLVNQQGDLTNLLDILRQRDDFFSYSDLAYSAEEREIAKIINLYQHIFYGHRQKQNDIKIYSNEEESLDLQIINSKYKNGFNDNEIIWKRNKNSEVVINLEVDKLPLFWQELYPYIFIASNEKKFEMLDKIWSYIFLTPKEDKVIEALKILEPKVQRVGFSTIDGYKTIRVRLEGESNPFPLNVMGGGMSHIFTLVVAAVAAENGVLLIDEIDTGLNYQVQSDMWRLIIQTARELNIQVFATTHSWDCICALQEVLAELEDKSIVKLFRLSKKYGKLSAVEYDSEDIDIAVRQSIEVR